MLHIRLLGQFDIRVNGKRVLIPTRAAQSLLAYLVLTAGIPHRREKLAGMFWPDTTDETARKNLRQELWRIRKAIAAQQRVDGEYLLADEFTLAFNREAEYWLDVFQMERPDLDLQSLITNLSLYQGELLPGFYEEWITLERERIQAVFEARMDQLLEQLITAERWIAVQEWGERWLTLSNDREPAYRTLMLASGVRGDIAKVATLYQRCREELQESLGVEPSAETQALYDRFQNGEKASPRLAAQPSGTISFLFSDIEESTQLLEKLGDQYPLALAEHHKILRTAIQKWNGREMDTQGDSFFVTFTRALDAVQCAAEAQRALAAHSWPLGEYLRVRIGLHTGEPLIGSTGYVGMDVHRAARIGDAGHGGQILLSQTTRELVIQDLPEGMAIRDLGEYRLKDMKYPTSIFQLVVDGLPEEFAPIRTKLTGAEAPTPGVAPFKGLQFFDVEDSELFFGRERLTAKLLNRLHEAKFLSVIIGASGSGKSSLVRAGLVPAIKKGEAFIKRAELPGEHEKWQVHIMTPTAHPLEALAIELTRDSESVTAVATLMDDLSKDPRSLHLFFSRRAQLNDPSHSVLVVDQFEELFTLCHDEFEREAFIDNLLIALFPFSDEGLQGIPQEEIQTDGNLTLIITLRADFYAHLAQYPELRDAVAQQQEYIGPMTTEELRSAIQEPAKRGHWEFEPGLVDLILRDVGDEPGALPLLSHALLETWKRRAGHMLTLKGYADAGGVHGAIAHTAENVYQNFSPGEQAMMRNILLRLTEFGEGTEDTRRRASFDELMPHADQAHQVRAVLNRLAEARLVTVSENTAEVAHEALIREWPQLREWLSQDREGIILHRRLTESAHEWELLERDADALYRGARLAQANEWSALNPTALNAQERIFLDASNLQAKREEQEREEQRQRELAAAKELAETQRHSASRLRIRNRVISTVGTIAIILAMVAGLLGLRSNQNALAARTNARTAFARELAAASLANLNADPERSILLALHGVSATAPDQLVLPEVENALHRAIASSRIRKTFTAHQGEIWAMAYSPDGTRLATSGADQNIQIWDTTSYQNSLTLNVQASEVRSMTFSPDGTRIGAASSDGSARIWNVETGHFVLELKGHAKAVQAITFSPDGKQLATSSLDKSIKLWDAATGKELATWRNIQEPTNQLVYSPDGRRILFVDDHILGNEEGHLHVIDALSGEEIYQVPVGYYGFALSPNNKQLALVPPDINFIRVLDAENGQHLYNIPRPQNRIMWMEFSPDSSHLAVAGLDRKVHVWDTGTVIESFTLSGHTEFVSTVAFSPDGKHLASGASDGTIKIWSLEAPSEVFPIALAGYANRLAVSPDGALIAATGSSPTTNRQDSLTMWDAHNGNLIYERKAHPEFPVAIAFSPDGKEVATGGVDYTVKVWDAASGAVRLNLPVEDGVIWSIAYHPDGQRFAVVGSEGMIRFYDRATGKALWSWDGGIGWLASVAFSPDGSRLAIVGGDTSEAKVWDVVAGKELLTLTGHMSANWGVAFSPDGARIVTCGNDGTARIWDAATGQLLLTLAGHTSTIVTARFSPDGTRITTASKDGTNRIWDSVTGKELVSVEAVFSPNDGAFTPDGERLVTGGLGMQVIALTIDELVQIARSRLTRSLTGEECQRYLHMEICPTTP